MTNRWYDFIPHPVVMLFGMLVSAAFLSYIVPGGVFERVIIDGRETVVAGSYKAVSATPLSLMDMFLAIPAGFKLAIDIIFIVFASGIMFGFLEESGAVENGVGSLIRKSGLDKKYFLVVLMTFIFGMLGVFVGYENNIAMVPFACLLSLAIGGDLMLAAGISIGAITVGFGLSPFNPYTIGTGQKLAQLPVFSGYGLRIALCFLSLSCLAWYNVRYFRKILRHPGASLSVGIETDGFMLSKPLETYTLSTKDKLIILSFVGGIVVSLYGVFVHHWFINHLSAVFCIVAIVAGLIGRKSGEEFGKIVLKSVAVVAPGAFMVGLASSVRVTLDMGHISDTISYYLSQGLITLPIELAAVGMALAQTFMNFVIPSGSGQALATLPVMIPAGEVIGMTRQSTVLAFQIGDGVSNLINPSLGGIVAMLAMCRIPFDRWLRFIFPLFSAILCLAMLFLIASVMLHYGPF